MFRRIFFATDSNIITDNQSSHTPRTIIADVNSQPETTPKSGLRRSDATTDLLAMEESQEILCVQTADSTVTMVRSLTTVVAATVATPKPQVQFGSCVYVAKGYEMEDTACSLYQYRPTSFFDVDGSSSSDYEHYPEHPVISKKQMIRSQSNTPVPDHLDDIWHGKVSPK